MQNDLVERIRAVIAKNQRCEVDKVTIDSTFEELGMDSLDGVNLLFAVEEEFDISISDEDAKSIRTVRQMVEGVEKLLQAKAGNAATSPS